MQYYLRHFFDPDFNFFRPPNNKDSGIEYPRTGYVQNVIKDQPLAELVPLSMAENNYDPRFVQDKATFPMGMNTRVDPSRPNILLADASGYVFYLDNLITVKTLLNVSHDVDIATGNIFFVGDMAVHGMVRAGFSVHGHNVRIMGRVDNAAARAHKHLVIEGGVLGEVGLVQAGGKLKMDFLDRATARAHDNILINKHCLSGNIYAGNSLVVQTRLYGGNVVAYSSVFVGEQIGNSAETATSIHLGYDPLAVSQLERIDKLLEHHLQAINKLKTLTGNLPPDTNANTRRLQRLRMERLEFTATREALWTKIAQDENLIQRCRLFCPGTIYPGVEITIGKFFMKVERQYNSVLFRLKDRSIAVEHFEP